MTDVVINTFFVLDYFKVWDRRLLNPSGYLVINTSVYSLNTQYL